MPTIQGTRPFELSIEIVHSGTTYDLADETFHISDECLHEMGYNKIPMFRVAFGLNDITRVFDIMDTIKLRTRAVGEADWLVRFTGYISELHRDSSMHSMAIHWSKMNRSRAWPTQHSWNLHWTAHRSNCLLPVCAC